MPGEIPVCSDYLTNDGLYEKTRRAIDAVALGGEHSGTLKHLVQLFRDGKLFIDNVSNRTEHHKICYYQTLDEIKSKLDKEPPDPPQRMRVRAACYQVIGDIEGGDLPEEEADARDHLVVSGLQVYRRDEAQQETVPQLRNILQGMVGLSSEIDTSLAVIESGRKDDYLGRLSAAYNVLACYPVEAIMLTYQKAWFDQTLPRERPDINGNFFGKVVPNYIFSVRAKELVTGQVVIEQGVARGTHPFAFRRQGTTVLFEDNKRVEFSGQGNEPFVLGRGDVEVLFQSGFQLTDYAEQLMNYQISQG